MKKKKRTGRWVVVVGLELAARHWCLAGSDAEHMEALAATSWVYSVV